MTILERLYILTGKLKIKSKDKLMSDLYSINFKIITEKSSNFENDLGNFWFIKNNLKYCLK